MRYLFEDHPEDYKSKMILKLYPKHITDKITFCKGNPNLIKEIRRVLENDKNCNEKIYAFFDLCPGNYDLEKRFNKDLRHLVHKYSKDRLLVIPIVCSEYYLIKSIPNKYRLAKFNNDINTCINLDWYGNTLIYQNEKSRSYITNYERFCKVIYNNCFINCISGGKEEKCYLFEDCKCKNCDSTCINRTLDLKCRDFIAEFPCIPSGIIDSHTYDVSFEQFVEFHRKEVQRYNDMKERFKIFDTDNPGYTKGPIKPLY